MNYWVLEYIKVLFTYLFTMFVWPSVVFWRLLKGKDKFTWFCYCTTGMVLLVSTVVLGLGLIHILYQPIVMILFYGAFFIQLYRNFPINSEMSASCKRLIVGTMKAKSFILFLFTDIGKTIRRLASFFWKMIKKHPADCFILLGLIIYGVLYFSWGSLLLHSYGFGDMYVHHSWIYGLKQGKVFSAGIYPEAMHTMSYLLSVCFNIRLYSVVHYIGPIHTVSLIIAMYLFLRTMFRSRFAPLIAILVFLIIDVNCVDEIYGMSRLQWTLPQEFAMFTEFIGAAALMRYLRRSDSVMQKGRLKNLYINEDVLILSMCIAASIVIHFYMTGMMFFLCVAITVWKLPKVLNYRRLVPIAAGAVAAVLVSIIPMGIAYAEGIPFQGSIGWAMSIIEGTNTKEGRTQQAEQAVEKEEEGEAESEEGASVVVAPSASLLYAVHPSEAALYEVSLSSFTDRFSDFFERLYEYGYWTLYRGWRTEMIFAFIKYVAIGTLVLRLFLMGLKVLYGKKRPTLAADTFDGYFIVITGGILFMILYASPFLGLPELIAGSRVCSTEQFLICSLIAVPFDFALALIAKLAHRYVLYAAVLAVGCWGIQEIVSLHMFHGFLYYEYTRYNAIVDTTNNIIHDFPKQTFTIVSTTDEIYQIIEFGFHEELLNFVNNMRLSIYTIPTPDLLIYLEKHPIVYAQYQFFTGPSWLANDKYPYYYETALPEERLSKYPETSHTEISEEYAKMDTPAFSLGSRAASSITGRSIMESQLEEWIALFKRYYPHEINVYYENDNVICYHITQNPARLTNLALLGE